MSPNTDMIKVPVFARYAYQLLFASHPYPWPCLLPDAQGGSTFLSASAADIPFVPTEPKQKKWNLNDVHMKNTFYSQYIVDATYQAIRYPYQVKHLATISYFKVSPLIVEIWNNSHKKISLWNICKTPSLLIRASW